MTKTGAVLRENGKKGKKLVGFLGKMTKKLNPSLKDRCKNKARDFLLMSFSHRQNVTDSFPNCEFSATVPLLSGDNPTCQIG